MKKSAVNIEIMWIHIIIAFLSLIGYKFLGETFKLAIAPYILYLVLSEKPKYFPALIVHFIPGTTISFLILFACLFVTIKHSKQWLKSDLKWLFILAVIPLPVYLYQTYIRISEFSLTIAEILTPMDLYLGIFPFFYGIIIYRNFDTKILQTVIWVLLISFLLNFTGFYEETVRYVFFVFPLVTALFASYMLLKTNKRNRLLRIIVFLLFIAVMLMFRDQTLTILLTSLAASIFVFLYRKNTPILLKFSSSVWIFMLAIGIVFYIVITLPVYASTYSLRVSKVEKQIDFFDIDDFRNRILYKAFEDRAIIWSSNVNNILLERNIFPPIFLKEYDLTTVSGAEVKTEVSSHNVFIELLRRNGIAIGLIVSTLFIIMIIKASYQLRIKGSDSNWIAVTATILACGVFGGMTGQFPLIGTFSFMFMGLAGLTSQNYLKLKSNG